MKRVEIVVGLVFWTGKLLIAKRHRNAHQGGLWEFPGGKLEPGESDEQALRRELLEEVGLEVTRPEWLLTTEHNYPDREVALRFYRCETEQGAKARPLAAQEIKWITRAELANHPFPEGNREILERLSTGGWSPPLCGDI